VGQAYAGILAYLRRTGRAAPGCKTSDAALSYMAEPTTNETLCRGVPLRGFNFSRFNQRARPPPGYPPAGAAAGGGGVAAPHAAPPHAAPAAAPQHPAGPEAGGYGGYGGQEGSPWGGPVPACNNAPQTTYDGSQGGASAHSSDPPQSSPAWERAAQRSPTQPSAPAHAAPELPDPYNRPQPQAAKPTLSDTMESTLNAKTDRMDIASKAKSKAKSLVHRGANAPAETPSASYAASAAARGISSPDSQQPPTLPAYAEQAMPQNQVHAPAGRGREPGVGDLKYAMQQPPSTYNRTGPPSQPTPERTLVPPAARTAKADKPSPPPQAVRDPLHEYRAARSSGAPAVPAPAADVTGSFKSGPSGAGSDGSGAASSSADTGAASRAELLHHAGEQADKLVDVSSQVQAARREQKRREEAVLMGTGGRVATNVRGAQARLRRERPLTTRAERARMDAVDSECSTALQAWRDANADLEVRKASGRNCALFQQDSSSVAELHIVPAAGLGAHTAAVARSQLAVVRRADWDSRSCRSVGMAAGPLTERFRIRRPPSRGAVRARQTSRPHRPS
jgi:hypothetical protein